MKTLHFFGDNGWLEDPKFTHAAWQEAVAQDDTAQGYIEWAIDQYREQGLDIDPQTLCLVEEHAEPSVHLQQAFPASQWADEVSDLNTRLGYHTWIFHQLESGSRCFLVQDIRWETDGEEDLELPTETLVVCSDADDIADALSDEHGWLVDSFTETEITA